MGDTDIATGLAAAPAPALDGRWGLWREWIRQAEAEGARTPFFLLAAAPIEARAAELEGLDAGRPVKLWYSFKTHPCAPALRWWRRRGGPVEVVSEFEFRAAAAEGYPVRDILINGPLKHRWLPGVAAPGLRVNFDSPGEIDSLAPLAASLGWRTGVRVRTQEEFDPGDPTAPTPFGMEAAEAAAAWARLTRDGMKPETIHFHLRTNVAGAAAYQRALDEIVAVCHRYGIRPRFLDVGGGLPPAGPRSLEGARFDAELCLADYAAALRAACRSLPSVEEIWLEHGRRVFASSGALVVGVHDVKTRGGRRQLLCDGGRTLQAMVSVWEEHSLLPLRESGAPVALTAVHGPTCMAFDRMGLRPLPDDLHPGDRLIWLDAGAYHLPWETRFSHGLGEVWWREADRSVCARRAESFESYWSDWLPESSGELDARAPAGP